MNCPSHCLLFSSQPRSYRSLPIRYCEFSPVHRREDSGALGGLTRLNVFHQDDGHAFCRYDQIGSEIGKMLDIIQRLYDSLGFKYSFVLSTQPEDVGMNESVCRRASEGPMIGEKPNLSFGRFWRLVGCSTLWRLEMARSTLRRSAC